MEYLFSSEAVSIGHPDKVCDQISDAIVDEYIRYDPNSKVAVECLITTGRLILSGEINSKARVDEITVAKEVLQKIGYTDDSLGFNCFTANYQNYIHQQSEEIFSSVETGGAGDQGLMFGYATNETEGLLPLPYFLAQQLMLKLQNLRLNNVNPVEFIRPDAKSQVTVNYINDNPVFVKKVVLSTQHSEEIKQEELRKFILNQVVEPVISPYLHRNEKLECLINPSGSFTIGGPHGDTGLTGRKIIVDTYGGSAPHGGGAFSGKDASKVDRSAAYMARYIAKHIVAANLSNKCTIQLSYAIGVKEAQSVYINLHGTGNISEKELLKKVIKIFDLTPVGITETLGLKNPIYSETACNGHFTNPKFPWEKISNTIIASLSS
jgi:S-adenosylmethionine synthetase